jgi:phytoene dehydrogenase-like protein
MGALVNELRRVALAAGVEILLNSRVSNIDADTTGVYVTTESSEKFSARDLLFAGAPQTLAKIRGTSQPTSLEGSQMKINMLLTKLPRLKSGIDPRLAFAGTFHVNESFSQLDNAYKVAKAGSIPSDLPLEMYCHTLTDPTILSPELHGLGYQTLTLFGLQTPASLFDKSPAAAKAAAQQAAIDSLNQYLLDPIESVLAVCQDGSLAIEAKSPIDLETDIGLPRGNIFHRDLDFPFIDGDASAAQKWGSETDQPHIFLAGAGARRGGGVSGIAGHNAAMAVLNND